MHDVPRPETEPERAGPEDDLCRAKLHTRLVEDRAALESLHPVHADQPVPNGTGGRGPPLDVFPISPAYQAIPVPDNHEHSGGGHLALPVCCTARRLQTRYWCMRISSFLPGTERGREAKRASMPSSSSCDSAMVILR